jgi:GT2 family glycosyltransferase
VRTLTQANLGASAGFHIGILAAYETGADWLWCMDDDTIPDPCCLAEILAAEQRHTDSSDTTSVGWICSVVRWSDGAPHRMNEPKVQSFLHWGTSVLSQRLLSAQWCSFVSVAFSRRAVAHCGLPLKEMFIWYDDVEFTARITSAGFAGLVALESQVEHRTQRNYAPDVEDIDAGSLWRFRYGFRNEVIALRTRTVGQKRKLAFQFTKLMLRRVVLLLRAGKIRFIPMAVWQGFKGLSFAMLMEHPPGSNNSKTDPETFREPQVSSRGAGTLTSSPGR